MTSASGILLGVAALSVSVTAVRAKRVIPTLLVMAVTFHLFATMSETVVREVGRLGIPTIWSIIAVSALNGPVHDTWASLRKVLFVVCGAGFVLWAGASVLWASYPIEALEKLAPLVIVIGALTLLTRRRWSGDTATLIADLRLIVNTVGVVLGASYVCTVLAAAPGFAYGNRYQGVFQNPNTVGQMAVVALVILLSLPNRRAGGRFVIAALLLSGIILSGSRTSLIVFLILCFMHVMRIAHNRGISSTTVVASVFLVAGVIASALFSPRLFARTADLLGEQVRLGGQSGDPFALSGRGELWQRSLSAFLEAPIVGHGLNGSRFVVSIGGGELKQAHSSYLEVLLDLGIVGAILLGVALAIGVRRSFSCFNSAPWLANGILAILIMSLTESIFFGISSIVAVLFWLFLIVAGTSRLTTPKQERTRMEQGRVSVLVDTGPANLTSS